MWIQQYKIIQSVIFAQLQLLEEENLKRVVPGRELLKALKHRQVRSTPPTCLHVGESSLPLPLGVSKLKSGIEEVSR